MDTLQDVKSRPRSFVWGKVVDIHEFSSFGIVEYQEKAGKGGYHLYVDGDDARCSFPSLDTALIGGLVYKYLGPNNSGVAAFIARALGMGTE